MFWDELSRAVTKGKQIYEQLLETDVCGLSVSGRDIYAVEASLAEENWRNRFFRGDNQEAMLRLLKGDAALGLAPMAGKINLIYIDPPFDSQRIYHYQIHLDDGMLKQTAYEDRWERATFDYLQMLTVRLCLMRDLLCEDGSILLHIDYHISHYVKLLMDDIFGRNRFINEIVWCYGGGGAPKKHYTRKHDVILWYAKGEDWYFKPQHRPYSKGTLQRGLTAVKKQRYELHREGATLDDWWAEPEVQKILSPTARENAKYETQKPEGLLRRIIEGHSREGDIVADFFCGSGTTAVVAEKMNRRWIMADQSEPAFRISRRRLLELPGCRSWEADCLESVYTEDCQAGLDVTLRKTLGGEVLQVSLTGYQLTEEQLGKISLRQRPLLEKLQQEDWLKLIDYWDVDSQYEGEGVFRPQAFSVRSHEGKKAGVKSVSWQLSVPYAGDFSRRVAVRIVDITGREQLFVCSL